MPDSLEGDSLGPTLDLRIEGDDWRPVLPGLEEVVADSLKAAARRAGATGDVSVLLTGDEDLRALNLRWRGLDKPTDVLSFPAAPTPAPVAETILGDIAIAYGVASRDAAQLKRPFDAHLAHLLVHGYLHLLGYDHMTSHEAQVMESLEAEILAELGWPDPYERDPADMDA